MSVSVVVRVAQLDIVQTLVHVRVIAPAMIVPVALNILSIGELILLSFPAYLLVPPLFYV